MSGGLLLQGLLGYNFSVAVWVSYIARFGIAIETGIGSDVMKPIAAPVPRQHHLDEDQNVNGRSN
jgi:Cu/Ag efflux pump CusA